MMESGEISSREKLDQMFSEGKITREDYDLLLRSMDRGPVTPSLNSGLTFSDNARRLPLQVWICMWLLVFACLYYVPVAMEIHPKGNLASIAVLMLLVYGLYRLHRWAFIVCITYCLFSVIGIFNPGLVLMDYIFGGILLMAYPHFFLKKKAVIMDFEETTPLSQTGIQPWLFGLAMTFFLTIFPWACSWFVLPRRADIIEHYEAILTLSGRIIFAIGMSYQRGFNGLFLPIPIGILVSLLLVIILTTGYVLCRDGNVRRIYSIISLSFSIAWSLIFFNVLFIQL